MLRNGAVPVSSLNKGILESIRGSWAVPVFGLGVWDMQLFQYV